MLQFRGHERHREGGTVEGERPPLAISNLTAGRGDACHPDTVLLGEAEVVLPLHDLDLPEPDGQHREHAADHREEDGQPAFKALSIHLRGAP